MSKVIKRDGTTQQFSPKAVVNAILKAQEEVGMSSFAVANIIADQVGKFILEGDRTVDEIQRVVEMLLKEHQPEVGRAYNSYRIKRDIAREENSPLHKQIMGLLKRTDKEILDENLNKDSRVLHTQRDLLAGIICKHYGLNHMLPQEVADAHKRADIWWHDLDYSPFFPITNCCTVDLKFMFDNGFKMGAAEISTPKSITTAAALTAQVIAQVASSQYGGTTVGDLDTVLAPYVTKSFDKHVEFATEYGIEDPEKYATLQTEKEVFDAMQGLLYEVNTLHTSNGQSPFITFGFGVGDTWEAKMIQTSILKNQMAGLGKRGVTPVFPKLVYAVVEGLNEKEGDPFYDVKKLAIECSSKRFYPDFLSAKINMEITGSDKVQYGMG